MVEQKKNVENYECERIVDKIKQLTFSLTSLALSERTFFENESLGDD